MIQKDFDIFTMLCYNCVEACVEVCNKNSKFEAMYNVHKNRY